jgi:predicted DNA-binding transcriptional regulator YafY
LAKYKPQHSRLLFIDQKIRQGRYPNCSSLAQEWEVSRKTIQRDIEYMRYQLDAPLEYSAKHRGYMYTEEQFTLPAMEISGEVIFSGSTLPTNCLSSMRAPPSTTVYVQCLKK